MRPEMNLRIALPAPLAGSTPPAAPARLRFAGTPRTGTNPEGPVQPTNRHGSDATKGSRSKRANCSLQCGWFTEGFARSI